MSIEKTSSKLDADVQGCIDRLPMGTDLLGIDGKGYEHHFSQAKWTVFVRFEDNIIYEQDIGRGRLSRWVDHIDDRRGWQTLNYSDGTAFEGVVDQLAAGLNAGDAR